MLIDNILLYKKCPKYRLTLCKPNKEPIQVLEEAYEKIFTPNVVETDELVFSIPFKVANQINPNWELIKGNYLIYLEQVLEEDDTVLLEQYFVIKNIINSSEDKEEKRVHCYSYEHLLTKKLIHSFKGVKKLYRTPAEIAAYVPDEMYPTLDDFLYSGILNYIISLVPSWSVGTVDEEINNKFRDLEIDAQSVLDFLLNKVQSTYDCVFEFDTINNEINVKKFSSIGLNKGLFISDKNYIKSLEQEINFDEVVTRLNLYGKDNMSIHSVNVTGQSYIDNLSFFRNTDYMSQSLLDALDIYDNLLESKQTEFNTLLGDLDTYTSQLATKQDELDILETELIVLEDTRDALIEQGANLNDINSQIAAKESEITNKQSEINSIIDDIDTTNSSISVLRSDIAIENNFTSEQIKELDTFIFEKDYRDIAYINPQELYEDGLEIMQKINQPPIDININIVDFLNIVECQHDWNKLKLGDIVSIQQSKYNINIELRIIGFSHDIDNNELTLRLSNKSSLNDPDMQLAELIENAISTTTTLDINKFKYGRYEDSGERSELYNYIQSELDLSAQKAVAGKNQNIEIGRRGAIFKNTTDELRQLRILNDLIAISTDGFQTADVAISPDGIIAKMLIGQILLGEQLYIEDENGNLNINGNLITIKDNSDIVRTMLGEYTTGKFGLLLKDKTGNKTILDEDGLLQTWQDSRADNVSSNKPLKFNLYIPPTTKTLLDVRLRFTLEAFRTYEVAVASGGGSTPTSQDGGNHYHQVFEYLGSVNPTTYDNTTAYEFRMGSGTGGNGANMFIKSPGGQSVLYTKGASGGHTHKVTIPNHVHDIEYGIYEGTTATRIKIKINGIDRTSALGGGTGFTTEQNNLNITSYIQTDSVNGKWNTIELDSTTLGRIDATIFIQALMSV